MLRPTITHSDDWVLKVGDTLLLSTDGFWGPLNADFIAAKLQREVMLTLVPKLLEEAERKAGADSDNLSVIGLTWEHQEDEDPVSSTITVTEPIKGFTTATMNSTQQPTPFKDDISDEEIQKAISEIQDAIKRAPK